MYIYIYVNEVPIVLIKCVKAVWQDAQRKYFICNPSLAWGVNSYLCFLRSNELCG
jgi:hypothetical protein